MLVKNTQIEIPDNNIFQNDLLDRKVIVEDLSQLVISYKEPFVLSINASWGTGKTTFVKLWQAYLKQNYKVNSIYFSAWEDDFSKEPLISILGEIDKYIKDNFNSNVPVKNTFKKAKDMTGKVLRKGIPAAIKGATAGVLDIDSGYEAAMSAISEETAKTIQKKKIY